MSSRSSGWIRPLRDAAADDDANAFDAVMDQVLERARDEAGPDAGLEALVTERLHATLGVGAARARPLGRSRVARSITATSGRWARYGKGFGLLGAGVALGFFWGRSPLWWPLPRVEPVESMPTELAAHDLPAPSAAGEAIGVRGPGADATVPAGVEARTIDLPQPSEPPPAPVPRAPSTPARATRTSATDSLRFALEQLRKAQLLLRENQPKRALEVLELLDARVAAPVLQEEREVTRALALCDAGDVAKASALAGRFLARAPDSAYAVSLRESCAGKAALLDQMRKQTSKPPR